MPTRPNLRIDQAAHRTQQAQERASLNQLRAISKRFDAAASAYTTIEAERAQAVQAAHRTGISIRTIAEILGISSTRVHQLLQQKEE